MISLVPGFCSDCAHRFNCPMEYLSKDSNVWDKIADDDYKTYFTTEFPSDKISKCKCMSFETEHDLGGEEFDVVDRKAIFRYKMIMDKRFVELYRELYKI